MAKRPINCLQALYDARLVTPAVEVPCLEDEPFFPSYTVYADSVVNDFADDRSQDDGGLPSGFGIAQQESLAQLKAAGECLEVICSLYYRPGEKSQIDHPSTEGKINTQRFHDALCEALPAFHWNGLDFYDEVEQWPVYNARTHETSTCPAQLISLSAEYASEPQLFAERTSAGLAAGSIGTQGALAGALLEQIERDSIAAVFSDPQRLKPFRQMPNAVVELKECIEKKGLDLLVFDITSDLAVPVVMCLALDDTGRGPFLSAGAAAAFSFDTAVEKAILESVQSRSVLRNFAEQILSSGITDRQSISCGLDRIAYWWDAARRIELDEYLGRANNVLTDGTQIVSVPSCAALLNILAGKNLDVWVADLTLPSVRQAGFEVVRAVVPGLHRLHQCERNREFYSKHYGQFEYDDALPPHPLA